METLHRAASAASDVIFGEQHQQTASDQQQQTQQMSKQQQIREETQHEPLSGRMGETGKGEPYDAGNLGDETSQQRIAASREIANDGTGTTTTTEGTDTTAAPRRSEDISPHSMPPGQSSAYAPPAATEDRGGSYSSARETAARALGSGTTGAGAGAGTGAGAGAGLWTGGGGGVKKDEEKPSGKKDEHHAKFTTDPNADAADAMPSKVPAQDVGVKGAPGAGTGPGATSGTGPGATGTSTHTTHTTGTTGTSTTGPAATTSAAGIPAGEGAPLAHRKSMTAHLPQPAGGEGMRRTSTGGEGGSGTGEKWVKSSGMKADGGDFDASAPGAGREADRLLTEKGVERAGGKEDKAAKEMTDIHAPNGGGDKVGVKEKIKMKLHKG